MFDSKINDELAEVDNCLCALETDKPEDGEMSYIPLGALITLISFWCLSSLIQLVM